MDNLVVWRPAAVLVAALAPCCTFTVTMIMNVGISSPLHYLSKSTPGLVCSPEIGHGIALTRSCGLRRRVQHLTLIEAKTVVCRTDSVQAFLDMRTVNFSIRINEANKVQSMVRVVLYSSNFPKEGKI